MNESETSIHFIKIFENENFDVFSTEDIDAALRGLHGLDIHLLIADIDHVNTGMKRISNMIKEECHRTGLIYIANCDDSRIRIKALEEGADDCLGKPVDIAELVAKANALLRRIDLVYCEPRTLQIHDIEINLDSHEVRKDGSLIDLTYTQFKLLYLLASKREYVFTRDEILQKVWGEHAYVTDRTVDVHVKRLREKLGEYQGALKYIQTIHGLGYRFA